MTESWGLQLKLGWRHSRRENWFRDTLWIASWRWTYCLHCWRCDGSTKLTEMEQLQISSDHNKTVKLLESNCQRIGQAWRDLKGLASSWYPTRFGFRATEPCQDLGLSLKADSHAFLKSQRNSCHLKLIGEIGESLKQNSRIWALSLQILYVCEA